LPKPFWHNTKPLYCWQSRFGTTPNLYMHHFYEQDTGHHLRRLPPPFWLHPRLQEDAHHPHRRCIGHTVSHKGWHCLKARLLHGNSSMGLGGRNMLKHCRRSICMTTLPIRTLAGAFIAVSLTKSFSCDANLIENGFPVPQEHCGVWCLCILQEGLC